MIDHPGRTVYGGTFAEKYPHPFVVIGHFNPNEQIDEEATGQPSYLGVLTRAERGLGLVGEYTGIVNTATAIMRLSFAYAEDALRFAELVGARTRSDGAFEFTYDRLLYDKLHAANAAKAAKQDPNLQLSFDDQFYLRALIESLRVITRATVPGEPSGDELNAFMVKRVIRASPELSHRHIVNRVGWRTDLAELEEYFQHLRSHIPQRTRSSG